jgi:hypothetical protein
VFGGRPLLDAELPASPTSGQPLHLAFDLDMSDARLGGLGVTTVRRLAVLASFHVDPARGEPLVVRHHDGGRRLEVLAEPAGSSVGGIPRDLPQLPVELEELSEAEVAVDLVDEYPDEHGPLHQVGGRPVWFTRALTPPRCPVTGEPMRYVATVDSERRFPLGDRETQLLFGDRGALYVFWSDGPAISASIVQSY